MADLLKPEELPPGFAYPPELLRVIDCKLLDLEPWWIVDGDLLRARYRGLAERYRRRALVPFAVRVDCDDVACFDLDESDIAVVHDFASTGYEQRARFPDFYAWFRQAIEDFIAFET